MSKYSSIAPVNAAELINHFGKTYDYIKESDVVLDVGCSTGYYARLLMTEKNCIVDGIEIDADDRVEASKHLRRVYNFNLDDKKWPLEVTRNRYDVIFLGDVIEHVVNATAVLEKLKLLLKEGGKIIISTPNIAHLTTRLELLGGNFEYERTGILDETHLKYFTLASLSKLVVDAGYTINDIDYSLNDLHPDTVNYQLNLMGLKPTKSFWESVNRPEARAYQWKIVLTKRKAGAKKAKIPRVALKPMENNYWFVGQITSLTNANHKLAERLNNYDKKLLSMSEELQTIRRSIGWRIEKRLRRFLRKFTSAFR